MKQISLTVTVTRELRMLFAGLGLITGGIFTTYASSLFVYDIGSSIACIHALAQVRVCCMILGIATAALAYLCARYLKTACQKGQKSPMWFLWSTGYLMLMVALLLWLLFNPLGYLACMLRG